MSAFPALSDEHVPSQDEMHERVRRVLETMTEVLLAEHPGIGGFVEARPCRDRPSGGSWRGLATMVHVSGLLVAGAPWPGAEGDGPVPGEEAMTGEDVERIAAALDAPLRVRGLHRASPPPGASLPQRRWRTGDGGLGELIGSGRLLAVRMISGPFLPGSMRPPTSTSPLTPPPRPVH